MSNAQNNSVVQELHGCTCDIQYTKGEVPPGREGHQAEVYGKNFFVFGGESKDKSQQLTIYSLALGDSLFNSDSFTWRKIESKGKSLSQRSLFSTVLYNTDVFIYGGVEPESKNVCSELVKFNISNFKLE